jgi:hypothetical protein
MNEGQRTRNRIFALSSVKEESITCHKTEIRIGSPDDERSRVRGLSPAGLFSDSVKSWFNEAC